MNRQQLIDAILREKRQRDVCILAHTYQSPDILEIADITGDSFALSKAAAQVKNQTILMCGVRFMAETVKILSPEKTVLLSHKNATCPMADQMTKEQVLAYRAKHPDHMVVAYINTSAELKSVCDVCVTSSSAVQIVRRLPAQDIYFVPDQNLGAYVAAQVPEKNIHLYNGCCPVHYQVTAQDVLDEKARHPGAKVAMHPECRPEAVALADFVGSTSAIIDYILHTDQEVIIATERGVYDDLRCRYPEKKLYQLLPEKFSCVNMKMTTLQGVYCALSGVSSCEITLDEQLRLQAKNAIDNMLAYGG